MRRHAHEVGVAAHAERRGQRQRHGRRAGYQAKHGGVQAWHALIAQQPADDEVGRPAHLFGAVNERAATSLSSK